MTVVTSSPAFSAIHAIDEADAAGTASEEEVRMVLEKFRQA